MIYFLRHIETGDNVKIGTAIDYYARLFQLEKKYGSLELLAARDGSYDEENSLHKQFADHRSYELEGREWFKLSPEVLEYIESLPPYEPERFKVMQVSPELYMCFEIIKHRMGTKDLSKALWEFFEKHDPELIEQAKQVAEIRKQLDKIYKS